MGAAASGDADGVVALVAGQIGFWSILIGVVVYARAQFGVWVVGSTAAELRWTDVPVGLAIGALTQLVALPALYLPFRSLFDLSEMSAPADELLGDLGGGGLIVVGLGVVIIAPIVEELFFRGLLLRTMRAQWGTATAVLGSSIIFGATHFQPLQFAGLTLAGLIFAGATVRTGRLGSAIAVHVGFNATTFAALVLL
ncbi:CPBP family intramembrane glutamic endopeptidase [Actinomarinicola tropica]|nr:CPBP family intramembrane glutamic endopeptidase [Actinomarinicola tropica]